MKESQGQASLFRVLKALSVFDPEVGFCQGMPFVAGMLLLYMGEEASAPSRHSPSTAALTAWASVRAARVLELRAADARRAFSAARPVSTRFSSAATILLPAAGPSALVHIAPCSLVGRF